MSRVSVITACLNAERFLAATVESLFSQTETDWEQIIVDDGSTDGTFDLAMKLAEGDVPAGRVRVVRQANGGVCAARNRGVRETTAASGYLVFLDSDDVLKPAMLKTLADYLDAHPAVGMVYCLPDVVDERGEVNRADPDAPAWYQRFERAVPGTLGIRWLAMDEPQTPLCALVTGARIIPSIAMLRRSVFEQTGGWDETFGAHSEDKDLFYHMAIKAPIHFINERLVNYRRHQNQASSFDKQEQMGRQDRKLREKWTSPSWVSESERQKLAEAWRFDRKWHWPYRGWSAGMDQLRAGNLKVAARFMGGAVRLFLKNWLGAGLKLGKGERSTSNVQLPTSK